MVGHTGDMEATTRACALVDSCVKELLAAVDAVGGRWLVRHSRGAWWRVAWQGAHMRGGADLDTITVSSCELLELHWCMARNCADTGNTTGSSGLLASHVSSR